jgi:cytochrome P450
VHNAFPPGPKPHPLVGNLPEFRNNPLDFFLGCAREYGDIVHYRILNINVYLLNHPDLIEYVLSKNHRNFIKGRILRANRMLLGNGLFTSEGDDWGRQRRLVQPAFHRDRIVTYARVITAYTERLTATWLNGETRDITIEMKRLTMEIIAKTLFDADISNEAGIMGNALRIFLEEFVARTRTGMLIPEHIPTPGNLRLQKAIRQLDEIVFRMIQQRRMSGKVHDDLLAMLLEAQDEHGIRMSDQQLRDEVMTLLLAGHETTALALTWTWYLLAKHPQVEKRLLAELDQVLDGHSPEITDIPYLRYTDFVLKEALRLYPPVWALPRSALKECKIGGYTIPAGSSISISQWVVHHDPRYFDEPDGFKPQRWENDLTKRLPAFAYFPFGGGPRQCLGYSFANMEALLIIASIASRFHFSLVPDHPVIPWASISLNPKFGIKVMIHRRTPSSLSSGA